MAKTRLANRARLGARHDFAFAKPLGAGIGIDVTARRVLRLVAPIGENAKVRALVGDCDFRAQPIEAQPLGEIGGLTSRAIERERRAGFGRQPRDEKIEQYLALRREQRGVARLARAELFDVVGQHALKEGRRILAADAHHPPVLEEYGFLGHGSAPGAACFARRCQIGRIASYASK